MLDVIDFFFSILGQAWTVILGSWILSASVLIGVLGLIIDLVKGTEQD